MKVQCKRCKRIHVNGEWTSEIAHRAANIYTYCPTCYEDVLYGTPTYHSTVGFPLAHASAS